MGLHPSKYLPRLARGAKASVNRWHEPPVDADAQARNETLTYLLTFGNITLIPLVLLSAAFGFQHWSPLKHTSAWHVFSSFAASEMAVVAIYIMIGFLPRNLAERVFDALRSSAENDQVYVSRRRGLSLPVWTAVASNAAVLGYLTYETGGPANSPYAQVLLALLVALGTPQIAPHVAVSGDGGGKRLMRQIKEYRQLLIVVGGFYATLLTMQILAPISVSAAPTGFTVAVTAWAFIFGLVTNSLADTIRADDER